MIFPYSRNRNHPFGRFESQWQAVKGKAESRRGREKFGYDIACGRLRFLAS